MSPQKTPSNVTSAQHQPKGPTSQSSLEESTYRSVRIEARQTQGIPGEFLAAYSPQADKIYVTGIFNFTPEHGSTVATIARVNPQTLQIEATAKMQVLEENHTKLAGQYQFRGAFGIDVDDEHGTLWVTDASSYTVAVYRQEDLGHGTFEPVWTSHDPAKGLFEQDITHPREVFVDSKTGQAFVTGMGGLWVISTTTFEVQKIDPWPGRLSHPLTLAYDDQSGHVYASDYYLDCVYEVDPATLKVVRTLPVPAGDAEHFPRVKAHGVGVSNPLNEIYVSTQGIRARTLACMCLIRAAAS